MPPLWRDCAEPLAAPPATGRCPACASPRRLDHAELDTLTLAHIGCDAFYAAVEKHAVTSKKPGVKAWLLFSANS